MSVIDDILNKGKKRDEVFLMSTYSPFAIVEMAEKVNEGINNYFVENVCSYAKRNDYKLSQKQLEALCNFIVKND